MDFWDGCDKGLQAESGAGWEMRGICMSDHEGMKGQNLVPMRMISLRFTRPEFIALGGIELWDSYSISGITIAPTPLLLYPCG